MFSIIYIPDIYENATRKSLIKPCIPTHPQIIEKNKIILLRHQKFISFYSHIQDWGGKC